MIATVIIDHFGVSRCRTKLNTSAITRANVVLQAKRSRKSNELCILYNKSLFKIIAGCQTGTQKLLPPKNGTIDKAILLTEHLENFHTDSG